MTTGVMQEIQTELEHITQIRPNIKEEVQSVLLDCLDNKPDFKIIDDLIDWKILVWEKQYQEDYRIQALFHCLSEDEIDNFYDTIILNPYIPVVPFFHQILLLFTDGSVLYGGARGGGKTEASLIGALQYVEFEEWKVGIFRLTYPDLANPGAIMDRAKDWLHKDRNKLLSDAGLCPHWDSQTKTFTFPNGAKITFGHVQNESDADKYQGSEFHLIIFDEAVHFTVTKITKIKGTNRKNIDDPLPLKKWYTGNPGGVSHEYFKKTFVTGNGTFIDSKYEDNPYLDQLAYERQVFSEIKDADQILYRQWKYGDWEAIPEGQIFKRTWFEDKRIYTVILEKILRWVRFWDLAATKPVDPTNVNTGPDWSVGTLLGLSDKGNVFLEDIERFREDPDLVTDNIIRISNEDITWIEEDHPESEYFVVVEQEGGSHTKIAMDYLAKDLAGFQFKSQSTNGKAKLERARAFVSFIKHGGLKLKDETWLSTFVNEITVFPTKGIHDDQVDSLSGGLQFLKPVGGAKRAVIYG